MAIVSILQQESGCQEGDRYWEESCYRIGCAKAREEALGWLKSLEGRLYQQRCRQWRIQGWRERTLVTRFGEIRVRRRLYRDQLGEYHFALDEYLGWPAEQVATPSVMESVLSLATQVPFRQVTHTLEKLTAGVISPMTVHRLVQRTGQRAVQAEEAGWQECFGRGEAPSSGQQAVEVLYTEADGVWIHLQRESQKHYEVKSGIAYTGWQRLKQREERYALVNKRVYCHANSRIPFWEGASLEWAKAYDWSRLHLVVVGGDGANWIGEGAQVFANGAGQLDGFHLARACGRAFGRELGRRLYEAVRGGKLAEADGILAEATPLNNGGAEKARGYVQRQLSQGVDWRNQVGQAPEGARGLGTMESNGDKLVANRMKKRGMSWTVAGAQGLAKVIQLNANGELADWCWQHRGQRATATRSSPPKKLPPAQNYHGQWLQVTIPALTGPHSSRPWIQALHHLAYRDHRLI